MKDFAKPASGRMLSVRELTSGYDRADVLHGVSIDVRPGEVTCILGANGAGKSTLIRTILGLTPLRSGRVMFGDTDIGQMQTHRIVSLGIGVVPEGNRVLSNMSVVENLRVGAIRERDPARIADRMEEMFSFFPRLRERQDQLAGTLSGGERSMLSVARGLMVRPELVIFDEPSLGLSPLFVKGVFDIVRRLRDQGLTILLVEQNVRQTLNLADHGYLLAQGRVVASGTTAELKQDKELHKAYFGVH